MTRISLSRPNSRSRRIAERSTVDMAAVEKAIADSKCEVIDLITSGNPDTRFSQRSFVAGSEALYINGVLYNTDQYTLLVDEAGLGIGVQCELLEAGDDVLLIADPVE